MRKIIKNGSDNWYLERCIDDNYSLKIVINRILRDFYHMILISFPSYVSKLMAKTVFNEKNSNIKEFEDIIKNDNSNLVFTLTPFHQDEMLLLEQFSRKGIILIASILSFDNISKKRIIPFNFSKVFVWNEQNKKVVHLMNPKLEDSEVEIIGPVQFDFYYKNNNKFKVKKSDWSPLKKIKNKRVILYSGGPSLL